MLLLLLGFGIIESVRHVEKRRMLSFFVFVSAVLAFYSFFIVPKPDSDLLRHFEKLDWMRKWSFSDLLNSGEFFQQPLSELYFFIISKTGNNGMLAAVTAFATYFAPFLCLYGVMKRDNNLSRHSIDLTFIFFVCAFMFTIVTGVRQSLGFAFFFYGLYFRYVKAKKSIAIAFIFFVSACLMHSSMFIALVLSIIFETVRGRKKLEVVSLFMLLFWSLFISVLQQLLMSLSSIPFFYKLYVQSIVYVNQSRIRLPTFILHIVILLMLSALHLYSERNRFNKKVEDLYPGLLSLYRGVLCFTWGSLLIYDIFVRFTQFSLMWSILLMPYFFSSEMNVAKDKAMIALKIVTVCAVSFYMLLSYSVLFY